LKHIEFIYKRITRFRIIHNRVLILVCTGVHASRTVWMFYYIKSYVSNVTHITRHSHHTSLTSYYVTHIILRHSHHTSLTSYYVTHITRHSHHTSLTSNYVTHIILRHSHHTSLTSIDLCDVTTCFHEVGQILFWINQL